eukprot:scaffold16497_cov67-Phaeocystis_antarctica.AAC.4
MREAELQPRHAPCGGNNLHMERGCDDELSVRDQRHYAPDVEVLELAQPRQISSIVRIERVMCCGSACTEENNRGLCDRLSGADSRSSLRQPPSLSTPSARVARSLGSKRRALRRAPAARRPSQAPTELSAQSRVLAHTDKVKLPQPKKRHRARHPSYRVGDKGARVEEHAFVQHVGRVRYAECRVCKRRVPRQLTGLHADEERGQSDPTAEGLAAHMNDVRSTWQAQQATDRVDAVPSKRAHVCREEIGEDDLRAKMSCRHFAGHVRHEQVAKVMPAEGAKQDQIGAGIVVYAGAGRHLTESRYVCCHVLRQSRPKQA